MIGCGIATTSAVIFRVPGGHGTTCIGGGANGAAAFSFAGSDSVLIVATSSLVVAVSVAGTFDAAVSVGAAIGSAVVFSTATAGVCAASIDAVIKIRVIAANEVTKYLQVDLKPGICFSFFACA